MNHLYSHRMCYCIHTFFLSIFWLGNLLPLQAQHLTEKQKQRAKLSEEIYTKIAHTIRDTRKQPVFNFIPNPDQETPYYNAYYDPENNTINFGEGIYDIAVTFGADSINALAMVIGHELAHFYKDHGWGMNFGTVNEDTEISSKIYQLNLNSEKKAEMEAEADYFGGIFGYMAGYNTLKVAGDFFDRMYEMAALPDDSFGYPSRDDRVKISNNSRTMLLELIPIFDLANYLTLVGGYEMAASCYDYIMVTFPGREMYNNRGVTLALEALDLYDTKDLKFIYPFGLDADTRLNNALVRDAEMETRESKRERLLKEALDMFEQAIHIDPEYTPAYINFSMVHHLLGEPELAQAFAGKGIKLAKIQGNPVLEANGYIARGISLGADDLEGARTSFTMALKENKTIASANLQALENTSSAYQLLKDTGQEIQSDAEETISEVDLSYLELLLEDTQQTEIQEQNETRPKMVLFSGEGEGYSLTAIGALYSLGIKTKAFLSTAKDYQGYSGRGLKIGDDERLLLQKYGQPSRQINSVEGKLYIYQSTPIIFKVGNQKKITGWTLYQ